jgi:hypothetical protein
LRKPSGKPLTAGRIGHGWPIQKATELPSVPEIQPMLSVGIGRCS